MEGHRSQKGELSTDVIRRRIKSQVLPSWHWLVNSANNKEFDHFQLGAYLFYLGFSRKISTKNLQLRLLCPGNNRFENGIKKAFGPNKLVGSSNSLYP